MAKIEEINISNYRALKDVTLSDLTPMTAVIGRNGVGKSSLFDAFGFLADCLKLGIEEACDTHGRGGFDRIRSQGSEDPIEFQIFYREEPQAQLIAYVLLIDEDDSGRPYVLHEYLGQQRKGQTDGELLWFLLLDEGKGIAWKGEGKGIAWKGESQSWQDDEDAGFDLDKLVERSSKEPNWEENADAELVELQDKRRLGIATLGALKQHPRIATFREFIEGWYLSYFTPDAARSLPLAGPQPHLSIHGDNLGNVVQFMEREHRGRFDGILKKIAGRIPGIDRIDTERSPDGRLLLRFNDRGFEDPFYAQQMSDGTLKAFAYLLMLEDPAPPPFICIEEPENGLYHKLLQTLAEEFRAHATGKKNAPQIFVTTHQPYFVDALSPDETWILEKGEDGFSTIRRASDDPVVKAMCEEELPLGGLWYSDYLD